MSGMFYSGFPFISTHISLDLLSLGSVETSVGWGGQLNNHLMASCVGNILIKNYQNLIIGFKVTVKSVGDVFWDSVSSCMIHFISNCAGGKLTFTGVHGICISSVALVVQIMARDHALWVAHWFRALLVLSPRCWCCWIIRQHNFDLARRRWHGPRRVARHLWCIVGVRWKMQNVYGAIANRRRTVSACPRQIPRFGLWVPIIALLADGCHVDDKRIVDILLRMRQQRIRRTMLFFSRIQWPRVWIVLADRDALHRPYWNPQPNPLREE